MEHPFRVDEVDSAADLKNYFSHPPIISREWIVFFVDVSLQVASSAVIKNEDHLLTIRDEEVFVEGDDIWMRGDELVIIYFACGVMKSAIDVVGR